MMSMLGCCLSGAINKKRDCPCWLMDAAYVCVGASVDC